MSDPLANLIKQFYVETPTRRYFGLRIDGIEVTQSTQYYNASEHLTDPADRSGDNSIPLIAGKTALVRVYLRNVAGALPGVSGTLTVERLSWLGTGTVIATLTALPPGTATAQGNPAYANERGFMGASLNFRIGPNLVGYRLRLTARIRSADGAHTDEMSVDIAASLRQTLRVRGIAISYQGDDGAGNQITLPRPTLAEFASTASMALAMFPVEDQPNITVTGDFNWFAPLTGAPAVTDPGGCAPSWNTLLYWLNLLKSADGNRTDRIYYGLVPTGIPIGFNSGCGGQGGVGAGRVNDAPAFAHECGHVLGFGHAPCGLTAGDPNDPSYPAYQPYDTPAARLASIGEYGVDLRNNSVANPASTADFMSYCTPAWIGPYHYRALIGHMLLDPRRLVERGPKLPDWVNDTYFPELDLPRPGPVELESPLIRYRVSPVQPLLLLTGLMRNGQLERVSALRLNSRPGAAGVAITGVAVEVRNTQGVLISRAALRRAPLFASGCGCGGGHGGHEPEPGFESGLVEAVLADTADIGEVRIVRDDAVLWTRRGDNDAPDFESVVAEVEADQLHVSWVINGASPETVYIIRWSVDAGADWETLTIVPGVMGTDDTLPSEVRVGVAGLRPGPALVEVVAVEGLHTVISAPVEVAIPDRPPTVAIIWPRENSVVVSGEPVRLWGMATDAAGERLADTNLLWEVDGRMVGDGSVTDTEVGDWEGEHRASLTARTEHGLVTARVTFLTTCSGDPPRRYRLG